MSEKKTIDLQKQIRQQNRLEKSIRKGDLKNCLLAIKAGADPNRKDGNGVSLLALCASSRRLDDRALEVLHVLAENGADINEKGEHGRTLLHLAAYRANESLCRFLLEKGADPTALDDQGKTPMECVELPKTYLLLKEAVEKPDVSENDDSVFVGGGWTR